MATYKEIIEKQKNKMANGGELGNFKCKCVKTIKFKNGLSYFKDFGYNCNVEKDRVSVAYEDGRFNSMSRAIFDEHFETEKYAKGGDISGFCYSIGGL